MARESWIPQIDKMGARPLEGFIPLGFSGKRDDNPFIEADVFMGEVNVGEGRTLIAVGEDDRTIDNLEKYTAGLLDFSVWRAARLDILAEQLALGPDSRDEMEACDTGLLELAFLKGDVDTVDRIIGKNRPVIKYEKGVTVISGQLTAIK